MNFLESDIKIRKIVDKITKYNTRNWLKATSTQRELWHGIINMWLEEIKKLEKEIVEEKEKDKENNNPITTAWGIIANVSDGDWTKQKIDWQNAAAKWRDEVFKSVEKKTLSSKSKVLGSPDERIYEEKDVKEAIKQYKDHEVEIWGVN